MRESRLWAFHLICGAGLLLLLSLHMGLMHYAGILALLGWTMEPVLSFSSVVERGRGAAGAAMYVLLLGFALYHGLYGLRGVLGEIWGSARAERFINAGVLVFGLGVLVYGVAVAVQAARL